MVMAPLGPTFTLLRKLTEELLGFGTRVMFVTDTQESLRHDGDGLLRGPPSPPGRDAGAR